MQLASVNLNHLVSLDALLVERNVRRAAERMRITQSAMSHTLRTLRELFADPLLVRVGNTMVLTPLAEKLQGQLATGLATLSDVLNRRATFDPRSIDDEFTLATYDGPASVMTGQLARKLHGAAPRAKLKVALVEPTSLTTELRTGAVDVALVTPLIDVTGLQTEAVGSTDLVVLCRKRHPRVGKRLSLDAFCAIPHAVISLGGPPGGFLDQLLKQQGRSRSVRVRVPYVSALGALLEESDLLAVVPRAMTRFFCSHWRLQTVDAPLALPVSTLLLCWHERYTTDPARRFFREVVREVARATDQLLAGCPRPVKRPSQANKRPHAPGSRRGPV